MLSKSIGKILRFYKVIKTKTDAGPLPKMTQYWLRSDADQPLSFWLDVPFALKDDTVNCVIQIPKELHGKFQVKKHILHHPMMQDTRKNIFTQQPQLRFYSQFPLFNYGYIPQTWQQNIRKDQQGLFGDNDPIDICDLSQTPRQPGDIFRGTILGSFCLIDQGQIDWKIFVIDQKEAINNNIHNIEDIDTRRIDSVKKWFKIVKVFDGKKANQIAHNQKIFNKQQTIQVVKKTREQWINLMTNENQQVQLVRRGHQINKIKQNEIKN